MNDRATPRRRGRFVRIGRAVPGVVAAIPAVALVSACFGAVNPALDIVNSFVPWLTLMLAFVGVAALVVTPAGRGRIGVMAMLVVGLAAGGSRMVPEYARPIPRAAGGGDELRLLTFNVWRSNVDPAATARLILATDADMVLLQEADRAFRPFLARLARLYPYRTPCGLGCGEVILAKRPIVAADIVATDGRRIAPGLLFVWTTAPDGRPVSLMTVHYAWPLAGLGQAGQRRRLAAAVARVDPAALILAGDMNLTPWSAAMAGQDAALAPLVRHTRAVFSWPARLWGGRWAVPLLPIDQIYAGPQWAQVRLERLPAAGSDHHPLLVTLARRR